MRADMFAQPLIDALSPTIRLPLAGEPDGGAVVVGVVAAVGVGVVVGVVVEVVVGAGVVVVGVVVRARVLAVDRAGDRGVCAGLAVGAPVVDVGFCGLRFAATRRCDAVRATFARQGLEGRFPRRCFATHDVRLGCVGLGEAAAVPVVTAVAAPARRARSA